LGPHTAGGYHSLGLRSDGTIVAWGDNDAGEGAPPPVNANFTAIAAGAGTSGNSFDVAISGFPRDDLNCERHVNLFDIDPFAVALTSADDDPPFAGFYDLWPNCDPTSADMTADGQVDLFDIDGFVAQLTGG